MQWVHLYGFASRICIWVCTEFDDELCSSGLVSNPLNLSRKQLSRKHLQKFPKIYPYLGTKQDFKISVFIKLK